MAHYLWTGGIPAEEKALLDGFFRISIQLSSDFELMALTDALGSKDQRQVYHARCQKIFSHPQYKAWSNRHGTAFEKYQEESK